MAKRIIVTVDPQGETTVKTEGFTGAGCKEASRALEEALGTKTAETLTPEYHQAEPVKGRLNQGT